MDVVCAKALENGSKDDPVTTVPIKFLCDQADSNYSTIMNKSFGWDAQGYAGVKYKRWNGDLTIKCKTFLRARGKLDRLDKIRENPEDHIFNEGGVSAD